MSNENKLHKHCPAILLYCVLRRYGTDSKAIIHSAQAYSSVYAYACAYVVVKAIALDSSVGVTSPVYGKCLVS